MDPNHAYKGLLKDWAQFVAIWTLAILASSSARAQDSLDSVLESLRNIQMSLESNLSALVVTSESNYFEGFENFSAEEIAKRQMLASPYDLKATLTIAKFFRSGQRLDCSRETRNSIFQDGNSPREIIQRDRTMLTGDRMISLSRNEPSNALPDRIKVDSDRSRWDFWKRTIKGKELLDFRFFGSKESAFELLLEAPLQSVNVSRDTVDGYMCLVLSTNTPNGRYTMWLDQSAGGLPRKIYAEIDGEHEYYDNGAMGKFFGYLVPNPESTEIGLAFCQSVDITLRDVEIQEIEGEFICSRGIVQTEMTFEGNRRVVSTNEISLSDIDLTPDFAAAGAFDLASFSDGTQVIDITSGMTNLELRAGQIAPRVSPSEIRSIEAALDNVSNFEERNGASHTAHAIEDAVVKPRTQSARFSTRLMLAVTLAAVVLVVSALVFRVSRAAVAGSTDRSKSDQ